MNERLKTLDGSVKVTKEMLIEDESFVFVDSLNRSSDDPVKCFVCNRTWISFIGDECVKIIIVDDDLKDISRCVFNHGISVKLFNQIITDESIR